MRIIDVRVRPPFKSITSMFIFTQREEWTIPLTRRLGFEPDTSLLEESTSRLVDDLREHGVRHAIVPGHHSVAPESAAGSAVEAVSHDDIAELARIYDGLFIGVVTVPLSGAVDPSEIEELLRRDEFRGLAIDPGLATTPLHADDPALMWVYDLGEALSVPVFVKLSHQMGPDLTYADPIRLGRIASRYPTLPLVLVHGAWPFVSAAIGVAHRYPNVFLAPDMYLAFPGRDDYVTAANTVLPDQVLYASSYPVLPIGGMVGLLKSLPFTEPARQRVAHDNAARLFDL